MNENEPFDIRKEIRQPFQPRAEIRSQSASNIAMARAEKREARNGNSLPAPQESELDFSPQAFQRITQNRYQTGERGTLGFANRGTDTISAETTSSDADFFSAFKGIGVAFSHIDNQLNAGKHDLFQTGYVIEGIYHRGIIDSLADAGQAISNTLADRIGVERVDGGNARFSIWKDEAAAEDSFAKAREEGRLAEDSVEAFNKEVAEKFSNDAVARSFANGLGSTFRTLPSMAVGMGTGGLAGIGAGMLTKAGVKRAATVSFANVSALPGAAGQSVQAYDRYIEHFGENADRGSALMYSLQQGAWEYVGEATANLFHVRTLLSPLLPKTGFAGITLGIIRAGNREGLTEIATYLGQTATDGMYGMPTPKSVGEFMEGLATSYIGGFAGGAGFHTAGEIGRGITRAAFRKAGILNYEQDVKNDYIGSQMATNAFTMAAQTVRDLKNANANNPNFDLKSQVERGVLEGGNFPSSVLINVKQALDTPNGITVEELAAISGESVESIQAAYELEQNIEVNSAELIISLAAKDVNTAQEISETLVLGHDAPTVRTVKEAQAIADEIYGVNEANEDAAAIDKIINGEEDDLSEGIRPIMDEDPNVENSQGATENVDNAEATDTTDTVATADTVATSEDIETLDPIVNTEDGLTTPAEGDAVAESGSNNNLDKAKSERLLSTLEQKFGPLTGRKLYKIMQNSSEAVTVQDALIRLLAQKLGPTQAKLMTRIAMGMMNSMQRSVTENVNVRIKTEALDENGKLVRDGEDIFIAPEQSIDIPDRVAKIIPVGQTWINIGAFSGNVSTPEAKDFNNNPNQPVSATHIINYLDNNGFSAIVDTPNGKKRIRAYTLEFIEADQYDGNNPIPGRYLVKINGPISQQQLIMLATRTGQEQIQAATHTITGEFEARRVGPDMNVVYNNYGDFDPAEFRLARGVNISSEATRDELEKIREFRKNQNPNRSPLFRLDLPGAVPDAIFSMKETEFDNEYNIPGYERPFDESLIINNEEVNNENVFIRLNSSHPRTNKELNAIDSQTGLPSFYVSSKATVKKLNTEKFDYDVEGTPEQFIYLPEQVFAKRITVYGNYTIMPKRIESQGIVYIGRAENSRMPEYIKGKDVEIWDVKNSVFPKKIDFSWHFKFYHTKEDGSTIGIELQKQPKTSKNPETGNVEIDKESLMNVKITGLHSIPEVAIRQIENNNINPYDVFEIPEAIREYLNGHAKDLKFNNGILTFRLDRTKGRPLKNNDILMSELESFNEPFEVPKSRAVESKTVSESIDFDAQERWSIIKIPGMSDTTRRSTVAEANAELDVNNLTLEGEAQFNISFFDDENRNGNNDPLILPTTIIAKDNNYVTLEYNKNIVAPENIETPSTVMQISDNNGIALPLNIKAASVYMERNTDINRYPQKIEFTKTLSFEFQNAGITFSLTRNDDGTIDVIVDGAKIPSVAELNLIGTNLFDLFDIPMFIREHLNGNITRADFSDGIQLTIDPSTARSLTDEGGTLANAIPVRPIIEIRVDESGNPVKNQFEVTPDRVKATYFDRNDERGMSALQDLNEALAKNFAVAKGIYLQNITGWPKSEKDYIFFPKDMVLTGRGGIVLDGVTGVVMPETIARAKVGQALDGPNHIGVMNSEAIYLPEYMAGDSISIVNNFDVRKYPEYIEFNSTFNLKTENTSIFISKNEDGETLNEAKSEVYTDFVRITSLNAINFPEGLVSGLAGQNLYDLIEVPDFIRDHFFGEIESVKINKKSVPNPDELGTITEYTYEFWLKQPDVSTLINDLTVEDVVREMPEQTEYSHDFIEEALNVLKSAQELNSEAGTVTAGYLQPFKEFFNFQLVLTKHESPETFLHEMAHLWLEVVAQGILTGRATTYGKSAAVTAIRAIFENMPKQDFNKLKFKDRYDMNKLSDEDVLTLIAEWKAAFRDGTEMKEDFRIVHEVFAKSFERYLYDGPQDTPKKLRDTLRRVAMFLRRHLNLNITHTQIFGSDIPGQFAITKPVSAEMRQFFDAMIEAETDFIRVRNMGVTKLTHGPFGGDALRSETERLNSINPEVADALQEAEDAFNEAEIRAFEELRAKKLKNTLWYRRKISELTNAAQKEAVEIRNYVRPMIEETVGSQPVYQVINVIKKKQMPDGTKYNGDIVFSEADLNIILKSDPQMLVKFKGMFAKNRFKKRSGIDTEVFAQAMGFDSAYDMIREIVNSVPFNEQVEREIDQFMSDNFADKATPEARQDAAERALSSDLHAKAVAAELKAFMAALTPGGSRNTAALVQQIRRAAQTEISRKPVNKLHHRQYKAAARRLSVKAQRAHAKGNLEEAIDLKRRQLFAELLSEEAAKANEKIGQAHKAMRTSLAKSNAKNRDGEVRKAALIVASIIDTSITTPDDAVIEFQRIIELIKDQGYVIDSALIDNPEAIANVIAMFGENPTMMSTHAYMEIINTFTALDEIAKSINKLRTAEQQKDLNAVAKGLAETIERTQKFNPRDRNEEAIKSRSLSGKIKNAGRNFITNNTIYEHFLVGMDGGVTNGSFSQALMLPLRRAMQKHFEAQRQFHDAYVQILESLGEGAFDLKNKRFIPALNRSIPFEIMFAIALNTGNQINLERVMTSEGYTAQQVEAILQQMTKEELEAVQKIWDLLDSLWPEAAAKELRVYNVEPEKVKVDPRVVVSRDGSEVILKGGYYPISYDGMTTPDSERSMTMEEITAETNGVRSMTQRGHLKARSKMPEGAKLRLDLNVVPRHADSVIRDTYYHEVLLNTRRLLKHPEVINAFNNTVGTDKLDFLWQRAARQAIGDKTDQFSHEIYRALVRNASIATLGFKVISAIFQISGIMAPVLSGFIKPHHAMKGLFQATGHFYDAMSGNGAPETSPFMKTRGERLIQEVSQRREAFMRGYKGPLNKASKAFNMYVTASMWMIVKVQALTDHVVWYGAYSQYLAENPQDDQGARDAADQAVTLSQGGGDAINRPKSLDPDSITYIASPLISYMANMNNFLAMMTKRIEPDANFAKEMAMKLFYYSTIIAIPYFVEGVGRELVRNMIRGNELDDEEMEEMLKNQAFQAAMGQLAGVPFGRELINLVTTKDAKRAIPVALSPIFVDIGMNSLAVGYQGLTDEDYEIDEERGYKAIRNMIFGTMRAAGVPGSLQLSDIERTLRLEMEGEEVEAGEYLVGPARR